MTRPSSVGSPTRWRTTTPTAPSASFSADEPSVLRGFNETLDFEPVASHNGLVVLRRLRPRPLFGQSIEEGPPAASFASATPSLAPSPSSHPSPSATTQARAPLRRRQRPRLRAPRRRRAPPHPDLLLQRGPLHAPPPPVKAVPPLYPLVTGRTVHWLCNPEPLPPLRYLSGLDR
ncbi:hypothetical protein ZWY2020_041335 [Hordeum vulgare]|nr:hypothetical protein ZWY2020_041335 [Hordeum vulgare]